MMFCALTLLLVAASLCIHRVESYGNNIGMRVRRRALHSSNTPSSFDDESNSAAKWLVSSLTDFFNFIGDGKDEDKYTTLYVKESITSEEVRQGILDDFSNGYLFSGQIEEQIYNKDCTFTDPTLSFKGLSTFKRNIENIRPILDLFLRDYLCVLYRLDEDKSNRQVKTKWLMLGDILLPWQPRINLQGVTTFTYLDADSPPTNDGRVISYYEQWLTPAGDALLQLVRPGPKETVQEVLDEMVAKKKRVGESQSQRESESESESESGSESENGSESEEGESESESNEDNPINIHYCSLGLKLNFKKMVGV